MSEITIDAAVPALVLIVPNSTGPDSDSAPDCEELKEEHDGNVFVGLKFAMIIYLVLAVGVATAWKLYQMF